MKSVFFALSAFFLLTSATLANNAAEKCRELAAENFEPGVVGGHELKKMNWGAAYGYCQQAARRPDATAADQFRLGRVFFAKGSHAPAAEWIRKSAMQGYAPAQNLFGYMHSYGFGVDKSELEAFAWHSKAASQSFPPAYYYLGSMHYFGRGVKKDEAAAFEWFSRAAQHNDAQAQYSLGIMHLEGQSVQKNAETAADWFLKAAKQEDADAQFALGYLYLNGRGVSKDVAVSKSWYKASAKNGHKKAWGALAAIEKAEAGRSVSSGNGLSAGDLAVGVGAALLLGSILNSRKDENGCYRKVDRIQSCASATFDCVSCPLGYSYTGGVCEKWVEVCD